MKINIFILILLFTGSPLFSSGFEMAQFKSFVSQLEESEKAEVEDSFILHESTIELFNNISQTKTLSHNGREYPVELFWINDVLAAIKAAPSISRKRLLFANMVDTLNGLIREIETTTSDRKSTKEEMLRALKRAMERTSVVKVASGGEGADYDGDAYAIDQPGEAVRIVKIYSDLNQAQRKVSATQSTGKGFKHRQYSSHSNSASSGSSHTSQSSHSTTGSHQQSTNFNNASTQNSNNQRITHGNTTLPTTQQTPPQTAKVEHPANTSFSRGSAAVAPANRARPAQAIAKSPTPPKPKPEPPKIKPPKASLPTAGYLYWLILIVCLIAFLVVIYLIARNIRKKVKLGLDEADIVERQLPPERQQTSTIYEQALKAAAEKDYTEAIRLLTIGSLILLDEHRVLNFQDTLTNGEYLQKLITRRNLHNLFTAPMALFDKLIYGFQSPDQKDFEQFKSFYLQLEKTEK